MYEIAEMSDYGFWIIEEVQTLDEAKHRVAELNKRGSVFMSFAYRKKPDGKTK